MLGDSLSVAYKLEAEQGWVSFLADKLKERGFDFSVTNSSGVGNTSADGLRKIDSLVTTLKPQIIILVLGSNDGLTGIPVMLIKKNLGAIIEKSQAAGLKVLLVGFKLPINYGLKYREDFEQVFEELSNKYHLPFVPFLLEGFATDLNYFLADTFHPNAEAQPLILNNVWPHLEPMLK